MSKTKKKLYPILKWVGGKRQLLSELCPRTPNFRNYFEPFAGGAALLFATLPSRAQINDVNQDLMNVYHVIKFSPKELVNALKRHENHEKHYYMTRNLDRFPEKFKKLSSIEKASRTIYLNKTCFNGLYRTNQKGEFNAAWGKPKAKGYLNFDLIFNIHQYFNENDIKITSLDFGLAVKKATKGDFVYFDPPYDQFPGKKNFTSYCKKKFDQNEHKRLKEVCDELHYKGVKFLLSNSSTEFIQELYKDYKQEFVDARRMINSQGNGRGGVKEILVSNYK